VAFTRGTLLIIKVVLATRSSWWYISPLSPSHEHDRLIRRHRS